MAGCGCYKYSTPSNRRLLGVDIDFSLPAVRVGQVLTRVVDTHGCPARLRTDNSPGFISARLSEWGGPLGIALHGIRPGKPPQNACLERFSNSFRRELLDAHLFRSLAHVRWLVEICPTFNFNKRLTHCLPLACRTGEHT